MEIVYLNKRIKLDTDATVSTILTIAEIREQRLCVFVDGNYDSIVDINQIIKKDSCVFIYPELSGRTGIKIGASAVLLAATIASAGAGSPAFLSSLSGGALFAAKAGILIGGALIATGLQALAPKALSNVNGQNNVESPTFSLTASGNSIRPFEPLPIVFGNHNIFPDFSSIPYNEYQTYDPSYTYDSVAWINFSVVENSAAFTGPTTRTILGDSYTYLYPNPSAAATTGDNWYRYIGNNDYRQSELDAQTDPDPAVGDKYRRVYVYVTFSTYAPAINRWVSMEDLNSNGSGATFFNTGLTFTNVLNYEFSNIGQSYPRKTEVVKQIMNYGFGDLVFVSNQIGTTNATDYRQYDDTNDGSPLSQGTSNWIIAQGEPVFSTTVGGGGAVEKFNFVNGNVNTVDGGRMDNVTGFSYPTGNYVLRQGPEDTFAIQVDIEGRQFRLDKINGGTAILTRYFNLQYRRVQPTVGSWTNFTKSMTLFTPYTSPYNVTHGSSGDIYRDTVWVDNLSPGQYEVRGQRIDENETSADNISEIYLKRIRFYQRDESQNYVAQNRKAIIVESDSQLNGSLNKLSSVVSAKCWVNDGFGNFTWTTSSNPADWLLYYARGAFKNTSADGTLTYPYSPTIGWMNNADHPDNGEKIFGAGISDSNIDFSSLNDWWNFCNTNSLRFDAVLDRTETIADTFKKICSIGRGSPTWALGKLGVVFENPNQLPVAMFTPENILKDSFEMTYLTEDLPDEILVNFVNRDDNWQQESVRATAIGITNPVITQTIDFFGLTVESQAQREANRLAARQTYNRRICKFSTDGEGLIVIRGDVIYISHDLFNWDYSSRIIQMNVDGNYIYQMILDCEIDDSIQNVSIRLPNNEINQYRATVVGNILTLIDQLPLSKAPYYLDQENTINSLSEFPESLPEDYLIIAGNRSEPGRKMRIVGVTPKSENEFEISCIEEDPGFYAQEYILSGLPPPQQFERIKASVTKADYIISGNGKASIYWELDGASAVSVMLSLNGSIPFLYTIGGATHFGNDVDIAYSTGDQVTATIVPIYTDSPYTVETKTISFTLL